MWYVIWTVTGKEDLLKQELQKVLPENLYRRCWIPQKQERQKWHGKYVDITKTLFPGYLFLDTNCPEEIHQCLRSAQSFLTFNHLLKNDDIFIPISDKEEQILHRLSGDNGCIDVSVGVIQDGKLSILQGALVGMEAYVVRIDRHKRKAYLEMDLFGRLQKFSAGLEVIEKN